MVFFKRAQEAWNNYARSTCYQNTMGVILLGSTRGWASKTSFEGKKIKCAEEEEERDKRNNLAPVHSVMWTAVSPVLADVMSLFHKHLAPCEHYNQLSCTCKEYYKMHNLWPWDFPILCSSFIGSSLFLQQNVTQEKIERFYAPSFQEELLWACRVVKTHLTSTNKTAAKSQFVGS